MGDRLARLSAIFLVLGLACTLCAQDRAAPAPAHVAPTEPLTPQEQLKRFHLPPGFEVQLVAAEPQVRKPINLNFDAGGRLFVTQSVEYPYPAQEGSAGRDAVATVHDFDARGRARQITTFADGLNIPIGIVPLHDGALVYSIPNLIRCYDADDDGRAERRQVMYREFGYRDTHGMCNSLVRWIDGWVYACHGFSNTSTVQGSDQRPIQMQSGNTFRLRADGSHVEYFTHGQVNPFGLGFDPLGNLFAADCHSKPVYLLLRGAFYPSFGKPHDGLGFGPEMIRHSHGSTGIAGVVYYAAEHFPTQYHGTLFLGNPITNRINHDRLEWHGSTPEAIEQPDFLTCDDPWFRPVDVKLGPDGALYIADFYNRIIGHYEVPLDHPGRDRHRGRIWRVVYRGTQGPAGAPVMPDLTEKPLAELLDALADENLAVRILATHEIVDRFGDEALATTRELLAGDSTASQRAHGLWIMEQLEGLDAQNIRRLANDADPLVRVHVLKLLAERGDWQEPPETFWQLVRNKLADRDPFVGRAAADALGRHPHRENAEPLLTLWERTGSEDTHLVHVVRMALRDHFYVPGLPAQLHEDFAGDPERLHRLVDVALGAAGAEAAEFVLTTLADAALDERRLPQHLHFAARHLPSARLAALYELVQQRRWKNEVGALLALRRAAQERSATVPESLVRRAQRLAEQRLQSDQEAAVRQGLELVRDFRLHALHSHASRHAEHDAPHEGLRPAAVDALSAANPEATVALLGAMLRSDQEAFALRQKSAQTLAIINSPEAREQLAAALPLVSSRVASQIAIALAASRQGGEMLLELIGQGKASPHLLSEPPVQLRMAAARIPDLQKRREQLLAGLPPRDERLRQLVDERRKTYQQAILDSAAGQRVFHKSCAACHRLQGQGTKIGPELEGIGNRGLERVLEDVLDPSRNVDQAFRTTILTTTDGRVLTGLLLREEGDVLVLADSQGKEQRVSRNEVEQRAASPLSPMPANIVDQISEEEFHQLIGYLMSQRQNVTPASQ